ncbi:hypothetical protein K8R30_01075 [archaeon]|nr:hypothetical protein [archaeon]
MKENLIKKIKDSGAIIKRDCILRDGTKSKIYIDLKKTYGVPGFKTEASNDIHKIIDKEVTCVAGMGIGGHLASIYGETYLIPTCIIRDTPKTRGTKSRIEGYTPTEKDKIVIIDDVYNSGSSIKDTQEFLQITKAKIIQACVILSRNKPNLDFPTKSVLTLKDIL